MNYFDTSFLTPLIRAEATSREVAQLLAGLVPGTLAVSHWTQLEFASVLARDARMGVVDQNAARIAEAQFSEIIKASFAIWLPTADAFDLARAYVRRSETGLRGGDALHLAIAYSRGASAIYSLDKGLVKAGNMLGLPVSRGISQ
jgi:predicted nucleic acid-binding protein